ncbi:MAG TPA: class E sortase [Acidimicrobiales bacterium]|nr:class E sortase [Acidimicrobiales bacterium]
MSTTTGDGFETVVLPSDRVLLPPPPPPRPGKAHAAWRPPLGPVRRTVREIGFNLITAGVVVLLFVAYQLWGTGLAEAKSQNQLAKQYHTPLTTAPAAPTGDNSVVGAPAAPTFGPAVGSAVAHMSIPKIGLDKFVVEGVTDEALREGPGHYPGTPMPGEPGNVAIAGHRTTFGAPFFDLDKLATGDLIELKTRTGGDFFYKVAQTMVVKPSDVGVIAPTQDNRLTLTTCNPRFQATTRLIVVAVLTTPPVTPPVTLAPPVVIRSVNLGSGNGNAWTPILLYGLAALALWVGVRLFNARLRRWRWVPFAVGIPLCCVPLWFVFENSIRLLPNNI